MVNTLVLYDVPQRATRDRLESLLRAHGFIWLFPHARWCSKPLAAHAGLPGRVRSRLSGRAYRILVLEIGDRHRREARWLTADPTER